VYTDEPNRALSLWRYAPTHLDFQDEYGICGQIILLSMTLARQQRLKYLMADPEFQTLKRAQRILSEVN
jgi:hypothetical protein